MINRDEALRKLSSLDFMLMDLGLYLNTHNNDTVALHIYQKISKDAEELRQHYENTFGALNSRSYDEASCWHWINEPWPWEREHNYSI